MPAKVTLPEFRISRAALGRRLASVILKAREADLSPEEFEKTVTSVFECCVSAEFSTEENCFLDDEIFEAERIEIEKSERRSKAAREAAERRRRMKEQNVKTEVDVKTEEDVKPDEKDEPVAISEPIQSEVTSSEPVRKKHNRRRRRRKNRQQTECLSPAPGDNMATAIKV